MNRKEVTISIIIPTYNSEEYFEECLLSVLDQNYNNIELIVIDGKSVDNTVSIIKKYEDYISYWVSEEDQGLYYAINKGIKVAKGEIIKILNSDDLLTPNSIKNVIKIYNKYLRDTDEFCILSSLERIDKQGNLIKIWKKTNFFGFHENFLHPTWYLSSKVYGKYGLYNTKYKIASDYEFYMRLLKNRVRIVTCESPLIKFREGGISSNFSGISEVVDIKREYKGDFLAFMLYLQIKAILFINKYIRRKIK